MMGPFLFFFLSFFAAKVQAAGCVGWPPQQAHRRDDAILPAFRHHGGRRTSWPPCSSQHQEMERRARIRRPGRRKRILGRNRGLCAGLSPKNEHARTFSAIQACQTATPPVGEQTAVAKGPFGFGKPDPCRCHNSPRDPERWESGTEFQENSLRLSRERLSRRHAQCAPNIAPRQGVSKALNSLADIPH